MESRDDLKAVLLFNISKVCGAEAGRSGLPITQPVQTVIAQCVSGYIGILARDLEAFAKHAKRSIVSIDDVKLAVRRNVALTRVLDEAVGPEPVAAPRKRKKNTLEEDGAASDVPDRELDDTPSTVQAPPRNIQSPPPRSPSPSPVDTHAALDPRQEAPLLHSASPPASPPVVAYLEQQPQSQQVEVRPLSARAPVRPSGRLAAAAWSMPPQVATSTAAAGMPTQHVSATTHTSASNVSVHAFGPRGTPDGRPVAPLRAPLGPLSSVANPPAVSVPTPTPQPVLNNPPARAWATHQQQPRQGAPSWSNRPGPLESSSSASGRPRPPTSMPAPPGHAAASSAFPGSRPLAAAAPSAPFSGGQIGQPRPGSFQSVGQGFGFPRQAPPAGSGAPMPRQPPPGAPGASPSVFPPRSVFMPPVSGHQFQATRPAAPRPLPSRGPAQGAPPRQPYPATSVRGYPRPN